MSLGTQTQCSSCGARNKVPLNRLGESGKCGRCKEPLPPLGEPLSVDRLEELDRIIEASSVPVVVDFWASWCGPCRMVAPEIGKVAARRAGQWLVVKANTERDPRLGAKHSVRSIPLMAVFSGGREVARSAGARPAPAIEKFVEQSLG